MTEHCELTLPFRAHYELERSSETAQGLLVLHGFADHPRAAKKRLLGTEPRPSMTVLAPYAPFPSPIKEDDGHYKEAFSWYFRDPHTGKEMIGPEFSAKMTVKLVDQLGLAQIEWIILGFSQGGYFAPHLVRHGLRSKTIITAGAGFRTEAYAGLSPLSIFAIHGEDDSTIDCKKSEESLKSLETLGHRTQFNAIAGLGHTLNHEARTIIQKIIDSI